MLLRIDAIVALRTPSAGPHPSFGADGRDFDQLAWNLAQGNGFAFEPGQPTSARAVGFPFVLSIVYRIIGHRYTAAYASFVLMGVLGVWATYAMLLALFPPLSARLGALLLAANAGVIYLGTNFASETPFMLCLSLATLGVARGTQRASSVLLLCGGLLVGAATLVRPQGLLLLPPLLLLTWVSARPDRGKRAILVVTGCALALAPWTWRNYQVHDAFVLVATNGGRTLYGANNDRVLNEHALNGFWIATETLPGREMVVSAPSELAADRTERMLGTEWIQSHPAGFLRLSIYKIRNVLLPWDFGTTSRRYRLMMLVCMGPILGLILLGFVRTAQWWRMPASTRPAWISLHAGVAMILALTIVFYGFSRFRDTYMPWLVAYAAIGTLLLAARAGSEVARAELAGVVGARPGR
jgi:4-amino-4-deoxy-L-arabinose transferase-like glycosyltransferase